MPKMKTHKGAAKRFKKTASGSYKFRRSNRAHILTKKSTKRLRKLRGTKLISAQDTRSIRRMLREE